MPYWLTQIVPARIPRATRCATDRSLVEMLARDERTHHDAFVQPVADLPARGRLLEALDQLVVDRALDEQTAPCVTHLTGVEEDAERRLRDRVRQIGVGEHDVRRLAAQLERDAREVRRRGLQDLAPD